MLQVSAEWLKPESPAHQAILASNDLAPCLPRITTAHNELGQNAQPVPDNPRLGEISKEQSFVDDRHDDLIRGSHGLLTATAFLLGDSDGAPLLALRDFLIPDGLSSSQKSYRAEAGQAAQLEARITPEIHSQLSNILVGPKDQQRSLAQCIDEWITLGKKLGSLEDEKARLAPSSPSTPTDASLVAARNKWIRAVNLFVAIAEAAELDPQIDTLVFGPLRAAEAKANARNRSPAKPTEQ
ncbi:MAG: hypothetical protein IPM54_32200 [Polyangiaceae bacterium]|nr:hypothetical protein [Polyangiaceae bacterium]